jgi:hypothetical protein
MRRFTRSVGPAALGFAVLGAMTLSASARAAAPPHRLVLSGYADGVQGENLMKGRYAAVIRELADHGVRFKSDEVAASTNLCVAYIMTRHLSEARTACDEALRDAKLDVVGFTMYSRMAHDEEVAIAYSNRAVLELVQGQPTSAANDRPVPRSSAGPAASP